jgi:hypothetical protein
VRYGIDEVREISPGHFVRLFDKDLYKPVKVCDQDRPFPSIARKQRKGLRDTHTPVEPTVLIKNLPQEILVDAESMIYAGKVTGLQGSSR